MFCTGCGTQSAESDLFCGSCGNAQRNATDNDARPAKTVFHVGQAMQQVSNAESVKGWKWSAFEYVLIALVVLCVIIAVN